MTRQRLADDLLSLAEHRSLIAKAMKESGRGGLQNRVRSLVEQTRATTHPDLLRYHTNRSEHSPAGFPDEVILLPSCGREIVAELKSEKGRLTPDQRAWLNAFAALGREVYLWRPRHYVSGEIARILSTKKRPDWGPTSTWEVTR